LGSRVVAVVGDGGDATTEVADDFVCLVLLGKGFGVVVNVVGGGVDAAVIVGGGEEALVNQLFESRQSVKPGGVEVIANAVEENHQYGSPTTASDTPLQTSSLLESPSPLSD